MICSSIQRLVPEYVRQFEPYIPSKPDDVLMRLFGCSRLVRMNNNENPLGPPAAAQKVIAAFPPPGAAVYPSGDAFHLRERLAELHGLHPDQFIVGNGANEVITFAIKAFCDKGDNIITADRTFAVYEWVARFSGYEAFLVPLAGTAFDTEAMLARKTEKTKIFFICNPNNPTGGYCTTEALCSFIERVREDQIVVVDEAYAEFVSRNDYPDCIKLIREYPNLVVFRTFSKMYGLAGLRIGYLAASREVTDIIRRTAVVYSINTVAQEAALVALGDREHIERTRTYVSEGREYLLRELTKLGLPCISGEGNFLMVQIPISDSLAYRILMKRGFMVRTMSQFRFPGYIRITIVKKPILEEFIGVLTDMLAEIRK